MCMYVRILTWIQVKLTMTLRWRQYIHMYICMYICLYDQKHTCTNAHSNCKHQCLLWLLVHLTCAHCCSPSLSHRGMATRRNGLKKIFDLFNQSDNTEQLSLSYNMLCCGESSLCVHICACVCVFICAWCLFHHSRKTLWISGSDIHRYVCRYTYMHRNSVTCCSCLNSSNHLPLLNIV